MILDEQALFSDKQAVTADAASTNVIKVGGNIAKGTPVEILAQVVEQDFATLTSLEIKVQTATDSAFTTPIDLASTGTILANALKIGYRASLKFLPNGVKNYIRLYYDVTGSNATAGKITAGIVDGVPESYHN